MRLAAISIFSMIILDHLHLFFPPGFDYQNMILFRNIIIVLLSMCCFQQTKKTDINIRSIFAVGIIFSITSLIYFVLWWVFDISTLFIFPVSFGAMLTLFLFNAIKNYDYKSDKINDDNVYICFWKPENAKTIFPSLFGAAIGSVAIYAGGHRYSFKWDSDLFKKRQASPRAMEETYIIVDTGVRFSQQIERELKKLNDCHSCIWRIKFLRFKCIYAIRNVLKAIGKEYSPSFLEFIPALYAKKILRLKNG